MVKYVRATSDDTPIYLGSTEPKISGLIYIHWDVDNYDIGEVITGRLQTDVSLYIKLQYQKTTGFANPEQLLYMYRIPEDKLVDEINKDTRNLYVVEPDTTVFAGLSDFSIWLCADEIAHSNIGNPKWSEYMSKSEFITNMAKAYAGNVEAQQALRDAGWDATGKIEYVSSTAKIISKVIEEK